jgi:rhodanese-related sulfurtransferase
VGGTTELRDVSEMLRRQVTTRRTLAGVAVVLAVLAAAAGSSRPPASGVTGAATLAREIEHEDDHVTAPELAEWIRARKPGLRVLDVRSDSEYSAYHIPSAERMPLPALTTLRPVAGETLVLYSEGGTHAAQGWVLLRAAGHEHVYFLKGGLLDWMEDVIGPVLPESTTASDTVTAHRAALSRYFGGVPRVGAVPSPSQPAAAAMSAASSVARIRRRGC